MDQVDFIIPSFDMLDRNRIEVFLDIDLDELSILFYGRGREHYVHPVNEVLSYLLDVDTDEVVGVTLNRFMRHLVHEHPEMRSAIPMSTIMMGEFTGSLDTLQRPLSGTMGRLVNTIRAAKHAWRQESNKEPVRTIINTLPTFARSA